MKARVHVSLKNGVLDPQGRAIGQALHSLGFSAVTEVRQGKLIELDIGQPLAGKPKPEIEAAVREMAQKLLANTVIENFSVELIG
ncbi:phosphoribosylformylglycinamidine synthase subunit PurS [Ferrovibrio sp.]|uniref:phosphoribosylformylglycinamidine synthase subunit PurS n=1 Tax=Ferrovibrio sp. TaxID=1917215 RepID=UPI001B765661|nr:phosphoribosylformylglycinamidine synthase subunit PurS [Ferrovibrio sp.]MBP7062670.1 phosphoribosylformylglycinamidine synthase subunit PurS [Ferrovibrio sp.]